jgi:hypothetical protein
MYQLLMMNSFNMIIDMKLSLYLEKKKKLFIKFIALKMEYIILDL